jgi:hypothetical protein
VRLELDFEGDAPEAWTPLEATVIVKALDEGGVVRIFNRSTPGLNSWEEAGMLTWALDSVRRDLQERTEEGES